MSSCFYDKERECGESCPFYITSWKDQKNHKNMWCRRAYSEIIDDEKPEDDQELIALRNEVSELRKYFADKEAEEKKKEAEAEKLRRQTERDNAMRELRELLKNARKENDHE